MIDVIVFGTNGAKLDQAEAATPEDAVYAGGILYQEALTNTYGQKLSTGFYVDGKLVRLIENRHPAPPIERNPVSTTAAPPVLSPLQTKTLEYLCLSGRASATSIRRVVGATDGTLATLLTLDLVSIRTAGARGGNYFLTAAGRELVFCDQEDDGLDDLSEEPSEAGSSERPHPVSAQTNRRRKGMTSTAAPKKAAAKKATAAPVQEGPSSAELHKTLLAKVKEVARGAKTEAKPPYVKLNLGDKVVAIVADPGKKTVRIKVPAEKGGYGRVVVKDEATLNEAVALVQARVTAVTA